MNATNVSLTKLMNYEDVEYIRQCLETLPANPTQSQRSNLIAQIRLEMLQRYPTSFFATGEWYNEIIAIADQIKPNWRGYTINGIS